MEKNILSIISDSLYSSTLERGLDPLLHIPKVGREAAYSALWY